MTGEQLRAAVVELTRGGQSAATIAATLGVTERTVTRHRHAAGIAHPPPVPYTADELETARRLLEDGASYREAARTVGRCREALARRLPGYGWSPDEVGRWARVLRQLDPQKVLR